MTSRFSLIRTTSICVLTLFAVLATVKSPAQQATASVNGTVRDPSGAVVAGAKVTLRNLATNISRPGKTSKDGDYLFTLVPIGKYELTVEQPGFDKYVQSGIILQINENARQDVSLRVGSTSQVIEVQANTSQVDTISATLGKVEDTQRILNLPLVERDTMQLGLLQAGIVVPEAEDGSGNPFAVAGQRSESMTFLIDGADNNDFLGNNMVVNPNPDAVAEFKVLTNNYEAEYGRTSGGIVNQVIKSGTNAVHGSLFEFFRNTALDASDYFTQSVPNYKRNLFGGSIGFPIENDKAFFFASYQGARRREGQVAPPFETLSPAERTGNFSELLPDTPLINPTTGNPYPNNQVPVDPVIANYIAKYVPLPNRPGNQFVSAPTAALQDDQFVFRFDYNLSKKDVLSAFYIFDDQPQVFPFEILHGASTGGDVPVGSGFTNAQRYQAGSLSWTRTLSPTILNELRFASNRNATFQAVPTDKTPPSALGFTTVHPDDPGGAAPPLMSVNGAFSLGPSPQGPTKIHDTTFQYQDTLSWTRGRHSLKFGADLRWVENNFNYDFYNNGSFFFGDFGSFTGNNLADFVGGFFDNYYQFSTARYGIRTHSWYFFGQDAWKITNRLTLDYGLRYEYNSPQEDPRNEIIGWYPGRQSTVFPGAPPGFLYPGDRGTPNRGLIYPDRNNFAPRFGLAWDVLGNAKLVMRGGFGVFYDIEDGALNLQFGGQPPFGYVANNYPSYTGASPTVPNSFISDPFTPFGYPNPYPFAQQGKVGTFFSPAIPFAYVVSPHFRTPYTYDFNYGLQYQLTKTTMVEAVYAGNLNRKAIATNETNYAVLGGPNGLLAQYNYFTSPSVQLDPTQNINVDCARPLAACTGATPAFLGSPTGATQIYTNLSDANSSSNQLQVTVDRQMSHGLMFRAAYTLSKSIDVSSGFRARSSSYTNPTNPAFDRGLADFDVRNRLVLSPIWQIPLGAHGTSMLSKLAGGWSVAGIISFQSGNPFTIFQNDNSSELNNYLDRADVIGPVQIFSNPRQIRTFSPSPDGVHGSCLSGTATGPFWFDPTNLVCSVGPPVGQPLPSFSTALVQGGVPLFTHGDMGRNSLRGPGINDWDISILKDFKFTESKYVEFQANFYNAFNHIQFYGPSSTEGASGFSGNFGMVTSDTSPSTATAYYRGPRLIQFALKFYF
ncbi:MAG TPA: carboxypeptidase regulatory-like domain-containing protein [Terriglobales bacterium]|nr:carboxypeptidase regulatory-like domain-containing protein [Terriglobales bacterium]